MSFNLTSFNYNPSNIAPITNDQIHLLKYYDRRDFTYEDCAYLEVITGGSFNLHIVHNHTSEYSIELLHYALLLAADPRITLDSEKIAAVFGFINRLKQCPPCTFNGRPIVVCGIFSPTYTGDPLSEDIIETAMKQRCESKYNKNLVIHKPTNLYVA